MCRVWLRLFRSRIARRHRLHFLAVRLNSRTFEFLSFIVKLLLLVGLSLSVDIGPSSKQAFSTFDWAPSTLEAKIL